MASLLLLPAAAQARALVEIGYDLGTSYSAALRFVRVDRGCKITDKDGAAAFVTFECQERGHSQRGALELYRIDRAGQPAAVRAQLTLFDDTHGMELRWLELFERKLRDEHGAPAPPPKPAPVGSGAPRDAGS